MSSGRQSNKSNTLTDNDNNSVRNNREKVTKQKQQQIMVSRNKKDMTVDDTTSNAARTLGKMVRNTYDNNRKNKTYEETADSDNNGNDYCNENDEEDSDVDCSKNDCVDNNNDDVSHSGFSNGSYDDNKNAGQQNENEEHTNTKLRNGNETYDEELQRHGRNDSVAMDVQLIKGVLPNLFAVLKFLEGDDDLVFNGIICRYFVKKLQVVESKQYDWWKRNTNAVRKSIDGRRASVSNLIKRSFMGTC